MRSTNAEAIEKAPQIVTEIGEIERAVVIVREAVAARVPCDGVEIKRKSRELIAPIGTVPADAVHEDNDRAFAGMVVGKPRLSWHEVGLGRVHRAPRRDLGQSVTKRCRRRKPLRGTPYHAVGRQKNSG